MSGKVTDALKGKVKRATLAEVASAVGLAKPWDQPICDKPYAEEYSA